VTLALNSENTGSPSVSIVKILPNISRQQLFDHKRCYLGISLDNPVFEGRTLDALLAWTVQRFEHCLVVIGDHLCRFNELLFRGCGQAQAADAARMFGDAFLLRSGAAFERFSDKVQLTRWHEHLQSPQFIRSKAVLDKLFVSNSQFGSSIRKDALAFLKRQNKHGRIPAIDTDQALKLSCEYLLEEIAVFSALSERGWQVELYPGPELRVLAEIAKGKYSDVPAGLRQRISVELKITGGTGR
jgi:tRNA-dependent cyclodipeptide synthase